MAFTENEKGFTLKEFNRGADRWFRQWPVDFHNKDYGDWHNWRSKHFLDEQWLEDFFPVLKGWGATSMGIGEKDPQKEAEKIEELKSHIKRNLKEFRFIWGRDIRPLIEKETDIEKVKLDQVKSFIKLAEEMKEELINSRSPVFASKFCHICIAPQIFPIIDNKYVGLDRIYRGAGRNDSDIKNWNHYIDYYADGIDEWCETEEGIREELVESMKKRVSKKAREKGMEITPHYPLKTRVIELCYAGRRSFNLRARRNRQRYEKR